MLFKRTFNVEVLTFLRVSGLDANVDGFIFRRSKSGWLRFSSWLDY
jgi:hypothetical protein